MPLTKLLCNILGSNSVNSEDSSVLGFYSVLMGKQLLGFYSVLMGKQLLGFYSVLMGKQLQEFWRSSVFIFKAKQSKIFFQYASYYCLL